jgi:hypothetical protein
MVIISPNLPMDLAGQRKQSLKPGIKVGESIATLGTGRNVSSQIAPNQSLKNTPLITGTQNSKAMDGTQKASEAKPFTPIREPLTVGHINNILLELGSPLTMANKNLIALMVEYGVPLTAAKFSMISQLMQGKNKSGSSEAAVIAYVKGLSNSPKSVEFLSNFLTLNPQIAKQIQQLNSGLSSLMSFISSNKASFHVGIATSLLNLMTDLDKDIKKMTKNSTEQNLNLARLKRGPLLENLKLFKLLLNGLAKNLPTLGKFSQTELGALLKQFQNLRGSINNLTENITTQYILSKVSEMQPKAIAENYAYWQLPSPLAQNTGSNLEILIKKENNKNKKPEINPEQNRIIIKFETPDLGEVTIIIDIQENKVWYTFNTENEKAKKFVLSMHADLKERMGKLNYELKGLKTVIKKIDLKKYLLPTINLDEVVRIKVEV